MYIVFCTGAIIIKYNVYASHVFFSIQRNNKVGRGYKEKNRTWMNETESQFAVYEPPV